MTGNDAWQTQWPVQGAVPMSGLDRRGPRADRWPGRRRTHPALRSRDGRHHRHRPRHHAHPEGSGSRTWRRRSWQGKRHACLFCGAPLAVHTLTVRPGRGGDLVPNGPRPPGPQPNGSPARLRPPSATGTSADVVGIPALSMGLLSWLPALIAGLRHRQALMAHCCSDVRGPHPRW